MTGPAAGFPFSRVVCAIDGSAESLEGARQGRQLAPGCPATLVYVLDTLAAPARPADYPAWVHLGREGGSALLSQAAHELGQPDPGGVIDTTVEEGDIPDALRFVTLSGAAGTLLTLGSGDDKARAQAPVVPTSSRLRLASRVLEAVGCSVLLARGVASVPFPSTVTVGVDGSEPSLYAHRVATAIATRSGAKLKVLTALGGKGPDLDTLDAATPRVPVDTIESDHPVVALMKAATDNGLIVVGNRGRHGLRALGSVSARVAARSPVSVLVVRQP